MAANIPLSDTDRNIVILGASYAGVSTAHYLLKHVIPKLTDAGPYQLALVSPSEHILCRPACPRALISDDFFNQAKLFVPIEKQFAQYPRESFRFIQGSAISLDHATRVLSIALSDDNAVVEQITFHALVIATGASTPSLLLGLNHADSDTLRSHWSAFRKVLPSAKTIVIAGGGPAGIETAAELGEYLNGRPGWFKSSKKDDAKVKVTVICASERILPLLRLGLTNKAESMLTKVGVTVRKLTRVVDVQPNQAGSYIQDLTAKTKVTLSSGEILEADIYIPATGMTPNTSFVARELLIADGRIATNTQTFRVDTAGPRIYSIGDCSSAFRPAIHNILSGVPILAANIKRDILRAQGTERVDDDRIFKEDTRETQLVPIGRSMGVGAAMGWALPSWMVWLIKGRDYWLWTTGSLWNGNQWAKES